MIPEREVVKLAVAFKRQLYLNVIRGCAHRNGYPAASVV
jgi:hypothetical protein